ncbi:MAG: SRPBCC family protein [Cyanobacteria bacterium P01_A01_bin.135]
MAQTDAFQQATQSLADRDRSDLTRGRCVVIQASGHHQGLILIDAARDAVWQVITDYESFPSFLPTVVDAQVIEDEGDRKLVEQVDERQVLFTKVTSRIQTENVETPPHKVTFELTQGDLNRFRGSWRTVLASTESAQPTLLLQTVDAEAGAGPLEMAFDQLLKRSIRENLQAIAQEVYRRDRP